MWLSTEGIKKSATAFINTIEKIELEQKATLQSRANTEEAIRKLMEENKNNKEALDIAQHAIEILRQVSDEAVDEAYKFLEKSLNTSLERMFSNTVRKIRLNEYTRDEQYPQLEFELTVANGKVRSLKSDSGHGLAQIVSLLSILSIIVITNSRRLMVLDEVLSGLSVHNLKIVDNILWTFTEIGFQFMINEHGFVPKGANVYHMEMVADVSHVKKNYIEENGVYLSIEDDNKIAREKELLSMKEEYEDSQEQQSDYTNNTPEIENGSVVSI